MCEPVNNDEHLWAVHVLTPVMEIRLSDFIDVGRRLSFSPGCGAVGGTVHLEIQQNPYLLIQLVSHGALRRLSTLWCKLSPLAYVCTLLSILACNHPDLPKLHGIKQPYFIVLTELEDQEFGHVIEGEAVLSVKLGKTRQLEGT